jgi:hypothetical protein
MHDDVVRTFAKVGARTGQSSMTSWRVLIPTLVLTTIGLAAQNRVPDSFRPTPPSQGGRVAVTRQFVGVDANPKASSQYRSQDYRESIRLMRSTPATHLHYAPVWLGIERVPGVYELDDVEFMMEESAPLPVALTLRILDAGSRNMPDAYKGLPWDSPAMIERVGELIDRLAPVLGSRPWSYGIGNEIDMYFRNHPSEIPAYARLLERLKARVRARHPAASFTTSFQTSATGQFRSLYAPILAVLDHVSLTYYPLGFNFQVRPPSSITTELPAMIAVAQPLPVYLQEIGYPTAPQLSSSPELQRQFVQLAFEAMRAAGPARVLGATVLFQADMPDWLVDDIAVAYGASNLDNFRAFIRTLGLRDDRDRPKPAWDEFVRQAERLQPQRR